MSVAHRKRVHSQARFTRRHDAGGESPCPWPPPLRALPLGRPAILAATLALEAPPSWEARLFGAEWGKPVELRSGNLILAIVPPPRADSGHIAVWVDRESTRERVPVEFELDVRPGGAKCYFF